MKGDFQDPCVLFLSIEDHFPINGFHINDPSSSVGSALINSLGSGFCALFGVVGSRQGNAVCFPFVGEEEKFFNSTKQNVLNLPLASVSDEGDPYRCWIFWSDSAIFQRVDLRFELQSLELESFFNVQLQNFCFWKKQKGEFTLENQIKDEAIIVLPLPQRAIPWFPPRIFGYDGVHPHWICKLSQIQETREEGTLEESREMRKKKKEVSNLWGAITRVLDFVCFFLRNIITNRWDIMFPCCQDVANQNCPHNGFFRFVCQSPENKKQKTKNKKQNEKSNWKIAWVQCKREREKNLLEVGSTQVLHIRSTHQPIDSLMGPVELIWWSASTTIWWVARVMILVAPIYIFHFDLGQSINQSINKFSLLQVVLLPLWKRVWLPLGTQGLTLSGKS